MGQRLVITIIDENNEQIAAIYYHWSAYTMSALYETKDIIKCIQKSRASHSDMLLDLIKHVEANGGGIRGNDEFKYIRSLYPEEHFKQENYSRNYGLIALSEDGMSGLEFWAEGVVDICLGDDSVFFTVFFSYDLPEFKKRMCENNEIININEIPTINNSLFSFCFDDIDVIINELEANASHFLRLKAGNERGSEDIIYEIIE